MGMQTQSNKVRALTMDMIRTSSFFMRNLLLVFSVSRINLGVQSMSRLFLASGTRKKFMVN